jgi:L-asparaginase
MHLVHPSALAKHLQTQSARVLTSPGTELLARELGLPVSTPLTKERIEKWQKKFLDQVESCDTVGALVRTASGALFAGTSTGGRGYEFPGRVSDSATVAGTYASRFAAISATGVGEEIVDDALAARLETRRRDGLSLESASTKCFAEANAKGRMYGWIAVDMEGFWGVAHTTPTMSFAVHGIDSGEIASSRGNGPLAHYDFLGSSPSRLSLRL